MLGLLAGWARGGGAPGATLLSHTITRNPHFQTQTQKALAYWGLPQEALTQELLRHVPGLSLTQTHSFLRGHNIGPHWHPALQYLHERGVPWLPYAWLWHPIHEELWAKNPSLRDLPQWRLTLLLHEKGCPLGRKHSVRTSIRDRGLTFLPLLGIFLKTPLTPWIPPWTRKDSAGLSQT